VTDSSLPVSRDVLREILDGYALDPMGIHGLPHWARVMENGRRIGPVEGADPLVVDLFALFHDARRRSDGRDREHGLRGAALARDLRSLLPPLTDVQLDQFCTACTHHTHLSTHPDATVRVCFDSDRLDLARVGTTPDPRRLCTDAARDPAVLEWAIRRGERWEVPEYVRGVWLPP
jgi:uncharacterized protein